MAQVTLASLSFAPARLDGAQDVETATVPGEIRARKASRPALVERQFRAWPGDVVVRLANPDGSTAIFVLVPEEARSRISARS